MRNLKPALITTLVLGTLTLIGYAIDSWAKQKYGRKTPDGNPSDALLADHKNLNCEAAFRASLPDMCEHCRRVYIFNLNQTKGVR